MSCLKILTVKIKLTKNQHEEKYLRMKVVVFRGYIKRINKFHNSVLPILFSAKRTRDRVQKSLKASFQ